MIDAVIDEHFRRSLGTLGPDYMNLFGKRLSQLKSPSPVSAPPPPPIVRKAAQISPIQVNSPESSSRKLSTSSSSPPPPTSPNRSKENGSKQTPNATASTTPEKEPAGDGNVEMSVDDHFAKALGDTWKQLQQHNKSSASSAESDQENDMATDPANNSNAKDDKIQKQNINDADDDDDDDDDRPMLEIDTSNDTES